MRIREAIRELASSENRKVGELEDYVYDEDEIVCLSVGGRESVTEVLERCEELLDRYRICWMCGKQLSVVEVESVHTCYDEVEAREREEDNDGNTN